MKDEYGFNQARHNASAWRDVVAALKRRPGSDICWKCGKKIDMNAPHNSPGQWTADHVQSMANGGAALDINNIRPAHRSCNSARGRRIQDNRASRSW